MPLCLGCDCLLLLPIAIAYCYCLLLLPIVFSFSRCSSAIALDSRCSESSAIKIAEDLNSRNLEDHRSRLEGSWEQVGCSTPQGRQALPQAFCNVSPSARASLRCRALAKSILVLLSAFRLMQYAVSAWASSWRVYMCTPGAACS